MNGDVTAIVCTRNGFSRGFLGEALNSIIAQTVAPAEIILVDDDSTDDTVAEVERSYPGVRIVKNQGRGLAAARNTAIRAARSDWIAFLDDDDLWISTKIAEQLAQAATRSNPETTIWASRAAYIGKTGKDPVPEEDVAHHSAWPACLLRCSVRTSGTMFSKKLYEKIGPFNETIGTGSAYEFWIRCFAAGTPLCLSEKVLLCHRRGHPQMTSTSQQLSHQMDIDRLLRPYIERLPQTLASRVRTARVLSVLRVVAWHCGPASTREYWARTPLRPVRMEMRACVFFAVDSAFGRTPLALGQRLRVAAVRLLLG